MVVPASILGVSIHRILTARAHAVSSIRIQRPREDAPARVSHPPVLPKLDDRFLLASWTSSVYVQHPDLCFCRAAGPRSDLSPFCVLVLLALAALAALSVDVPRERQMCTDER